MDALRKVSPDRERAKADKEMDNIFTDPEFQAMFKEYLRKKLSAP